KIFSGTMDKEGRFVNRPHLLHDTDYNYWKSPKKFDMKVTFIEEAQDISNMKVDELVGSLQTFEFGINDRFEKENKSIAFVSNTDDEEMQCDME
ncbi:gag-pol polyprotein, partial [Trifolium medium]|nr:gag-pol polyprotein [Trifolium medium]